VPASVKIERRSVGVVICIVWSDVQLQIVCIIMVQPMPLPSRTPLSLA